MHATFTFLARAPLVVAAADPLGLGLGEVLIAVGVGIAGSVALGVIFWWYSSRRVREMQTLEDRYRTLFEEASVPILEEDFTEVSRWLDNLRDSGVEDIQTYVKAHPDEMREQFARIRVTAANRLGLALLGAEDLEHLLELMRDSSGVVTPETFPLELEALWFGRTSLDCETTLRVPGKPLRRGRLLWSMMTRRRGVPDPSRVLLTFTDLAELRSSEERYEQIFEALPVPVLVSDAQTLQFIDVNSAAVRVYGWGRAEFLGMRVSDIQEVNGTGEIEAALRKMNPDPLASFVARHRTKNGLTVDVEVTNRPVDLGGRRAIMTMARDVTEKVRAEEALRASEERFRLLFENAAEGVYESVPSGGFRNVNPAFARMLGFNEPREVHQMRPDAIAEWYVLPHRREAFMTEMAASDVLMGFESEVRRKDGSLIWISENVRAIKDASGKILHFQGFVSDITGRKRAENSLRQSEWRYRTLFEQSPVAIVELDYSGALPLLDEILKASGKAAAPDWGAYPDLAERTLSGVKLTGLNEAMVRALAASTKQHVLSGHETILTPEARTCVLGTVAAMARGKHWIEGEVLLNRLDGTPRTFYWRWWMPPNTAGHAVGNVQAALLDITDMRQTEAALRASEQRYRVLFEHSPIGIAEYDYREAIAWLDQLRGKGVVDLQAWMDQNPAEVSAAMFRMNLVGANAAMLRLVGSSSVEEAARLQTRLFTPEVFAARQAGFLAAWSGRNETEGEITLRSLDGTLRRVYHRWWIPLVNGHPFYERSQLAIIDLTAVKVAEGHLAAERERLGVTLGAMSEGVITVNAEGIVEFMNEAAGSMTGAGRSGLVSMPIRSVLTLRHQKTGVPVEPPIKAAIDADRAIELPPQTQLVRADESASLVEGRCAPIHDSQGHAAGAVLVLRDVTERARWETELLRASKLESVGLLAGGIAHDFNNLLAIMMGNLNLAMLDEAAMAAAGKWLREAERGAQRARDLTQQLLTFAKGGEPLLSAVYLPDVVREAAEFAIHGANVRVDFDLAVNLRSADADKGQIGQVVQNLVINAVQAMSAGGVIRVSMANETIDEGHPTLPPGDYVLLVIADNGPGIRDEHLPHIFEPYFTTKEEGLGLGLATVYSIVRKHHGTVTVESRPGTGTTFSIWLPAAKASQADPDASAAPFVPLSGKILFMDDEEPIRRMAQSLLKKLGLEVQTVDTGEKAVEAYAEARASGRPFDGVMMDLTVPGGMGGTQALAEMKKIDPDVRAIVSSGYSSDPVLANFRDYGFVAVVPKPYRIPELIKALRDVFPGRAP